jgi:Dyp-type peroxidase family
MAFFDGQSLGGGREHFGFRDNITDPKPVPVGNPGGVADGVDYTEFILTGGALPHGPDPTPPAWTANGSYMVFRRLRQHVAAFRDRAATAATELNPHVPPANALTGPFFQAKCVGRWPDGTAVGETATPVLTGPTDITAMDYIGDRPGMKIPRFSHIRKGHPRDLGKDSSGNPIAGQDTAQNHRLIRRGIPYGPALPEGAPDDGRDRGLLFVAYQASLSEQFEFIAGQWLNIRAFPELAANVQAPLPGTNRRAGEDPIVGANSDGLAVQRLILYPTTATTSGANVSITVQQVLLDKFVTMRGGGYFFCPGIASLAQLAGATP